MAENNYVCPYCGKEIRKEEILFWEKVNTQYIDNIRGEFLRKHGVRVAAGNRFPRMYYRVAAEKVIREDDNGYPTMIEDHLGNAVPPEELGKKESATGEPFDDEFESDGFEEGIERQSERRDRELHNIPRRACPFCHCELPQQFGMLKTYHVAMFGGRASGKTAYLVNLFQQLKYQLSTNDLGTAVLEAESDNFLQPMIEDYEKEGTTRPTPADGGLMPILCHYKNRMDEAFVVFYDIAGEGTSDPFYMANHKGIANCESLILMIDSNMFVGGAFYSAWTANHFSGEDRYNDSGDCCREPLDSFLYSAGELCREYSDRIRNIICVITKVDMMLEADSKYFSSGEIELLQDVGEKHRGAVDLGVLSRISRDINTYLNAAYKIRLEDKLKYIFGNEVRTQILGVSTSTRVREKGTAIKFEPRSSASDLKHRIIEPFLVTLMYFSLIPARFPDGTVRYFDGNKSVEMPPEPGSNEAEKKPEKKRGWFFGRRHKE